MIRRSHQPGQSRRQGVISMELILTLPILLMLLLGIFEFSFLMSARGDVVQASRAGCRLATLNGVVPEDVENEVVRTLGTVRVPMAAVAPNLLWPLGYNLQGRDLISQTRMLKE
jgi:Flp pilus assembly protein TadG